MEVTRADGSKLPLDPPFPVLLSYEHALRKEAFRRAVEEECQVAPHTFKRALKEVIRDSEIKDLYFTSSLTMTTKRPHEQASSSLALPVLLLVLLLVLLRTGPSLQPWKRPKAAKGNGRGKGKGGTGAAPNEGLSNIGKHVIPRLTMEAPDGKMICFQYNHGTCKAERCKFLHICRIKGCGLEHPMVKREGW